MTRPAFPKLAKMMGGWFNQDYDVEGFDDAGLLDSYARSSWAEDLTVTIAEIDELLALPTAGLLGRFIAGTGFGNMLIADDDEGVRRWLSDARDRLAAFRDTGRPSS